MAKIHSMFSSIKDAPMADISTRTIDFGAKTIYIGQTMVGILSKEGGFYPDKDATEEQIKRIEQELAKRQL